MNFCFTLVDNFGLQLGVSSVSELRQALGTSSDVPAKKQAVSEGSEEKPSSKDQPDGLVYTDSSTFLKVGLQHFYLKQKG